MAQLLVVDDDADVLHLAWTQMRARGRKVLAAPSGPEALEAQLWGPPEVAELDVAMPAMDGLELLQQLRAATGIAELSAVFLSARVDRQTVEAAHRLGAAYLAGRSWERSVRRHRGGPGRRLPRTPRGREGAFAVTAEPLMSGIAEELARHPRRSVGLPSNG
jgi:two-component system, OmpR family, response regulator